MRRAAKSTKPSRTTGPRLAPPPVELTLYVSAHSHYASVARRNCEALLKRFDKKQIRLEVCDISREPERAEEDAVCYTPMLVKREPLPRAYVIGDLSNPAAVLHVLASCGVEPVR